MLSESESVRPTVNIDIIRLGILRNLIGIWSMIMCYHQIVSPLQFLIFFVIIIYIPK